MSRRVGASHQVGAGPAASELLHLQPPHDDLRGTLQVVRGGRHLRARLPEGGLPAAARPAVEAGLAG